MLDANQNSVEVIHADEAVFHQRIVQKKSWANKGTNVSPGVMLHHEPCQAAVGFVSLMRGPIHFDTLHELELTKDQLLS